MNLKKQISIDIKKPYVKIVLNRLLYLERPFY